MTTNNLFIKKDNPSELECLVLEGGRTSTIAFLGSLLELQKGGYLKNIKYVIGSSSGALQALFVVLRVDIQNIINGIYASDFSSMQEKSFFYLGDIYRFFKKYGFDDGCMYEEWIDKLIVQCLQCQPNITFQQLFNKTGIEFTVTVTNLNKRCTEYFSYKNQPNMIVAHAVRISSSLPIYFTPVLVGGNYYCDGGLLNNYPIYYYDFKYKTLQEATSKTLGLKILAVDETIIGTTISINDQINTLEDYLLSVLNTFMTHIERSEIKKDYWERTIPVYVNDNSVINVDLVTKKNLVEIGSKTVVNYIL